VKLDENKTNKQSKGSLVAYIFDQKLKKADNNVSCTTC